MTDGAPALKALYPVAAHLKKSGLEDQLLHLVYLRVSQINGCGFCLDMHSKDLLAAGEPVQRLILLNAWREAPFYTEREQAALAWAEALTKLEATLVPDAIYDAAQKQFSREELVDLTLAITTINTYNRFNIAFGGPVGSYQPGQFAVN
ncbi:carboxymuconolactone decarboxylase family protein [Niabella terrae]